MELRPFVPHLWRLTSAAFMGAALGFLGGALNEAWERLSAGLYHRATLYVVLTLIGCALLSAWMAALARALATVDAAPTSVPGPRRLVVIVRST